MALTINITIGGATVGTVSDLPFVSGQNVQQVLEAAFNADPALSGTLGFSARYYGSSLGYELLTLDAISNQTGSDGSYLFWELLINGTVTSTGMDTTYPKDGDTIEWSYTTYAADRHDGTNYEGIRGVVTR